LGEIVTKTDSRVDVYALGMTCEHPLAALTSEQAMKSRIAHDFVPDTLPRWEQEIVLRATHPTPELRFQTMAEFAEAIRARHVPYVLDSKLIKAHALAEKSEAQLTRKKWKAAETLANRALHLSPDCANALIAAGRCQLLLRRIGDAKALFDRAPTVNPRIHVQKELDWLNLEQGHLPVAISLLSDHLDRNASDFEAFNLLLSASACPSATKGEELARLMMNEKVPNGCFLNNRFLCRLLNEGYTNASLNAIDAHTLNNPFVSYNLAVARESPRNWDRGGVRLLRGKLVFQEFRFKVSRNSAKRNRLRFQLNGGDRHETTDPVISIGSLAANDIVVSGASVSRRHAVLVNLPDEVWVYDL
jgi:tetratricopeptide (TPR) repeat protein